ncbi:MAG: hypothetical protein ACR2HM_08745 [Acidimicrobiales bacterium]
MKTSLEFPDAGASGVVGRCDLIGALDANSSFRRDSFWGGILHPGRISYRETSPTDSLHILIDEAGNVSAHIDDISPLRLRADGSTRYAWGRVLAHNVLVVVEDGARRLRGMRGVQRCNLHCDVEWYDDSELCDDEEPGTAP